MKTMNIFSRMLKKRKKYFRYDLFVNEGDIVIDPFSGSGITAIAAWDLNRKFICYEIDDEYYSKSLKYLDEFKRGLHNDILDKVHKKLGYGVGQIKQVTFSNVDYRQQPKDL